MNLREYQVAARDIDELYLNNLYAAERNSNGNTIGHLRWMVQEICNGMPEKKAIRWLGYIQGALVASGCATLADMKEVNKRAWRP